MKPVQSVDFWHRRVFETIAEGKMLHSIIYDCSYELWKSIQYQCADIIAEFISSDSKLLDPGCGYGGLVDSIEYVSLNVDYIGVDVSPDLIELANYRYPNRIFICGDLKKVLSNQEDDLFDWAVIRGVKDMLIENFGDEEWEIVRDKINRVSKNQLIITYPDEMGQKIDYEVIRQ